MQTKNNTSKPDTELNQETGEGCSGATCSPSSEVERVMTDKFRDGNDLPALARKHAEELEAAYSAIRFAAARFERISWGYDGDCGSKDIIETLEDILPENSLVKLQWKILKPKSPTNQIKTTNK